MRARLITWSLLLVAALSVILSYSYKAPTGHGGWCYWVVPDPTGAFYAVYDPAAPIDESDELTAVTPTVSVFARDATLPAVTAGPHPGDGFVGLSDNWTPITRPTDRAPSDRLLWSHRVGAAEPGISVRSDGRALALIAYASDSVAIVDDVGITTTYSRDDLMLGKSVWCRLNGQFIDRNGVSRADFTADSTQLIVTSSNGRVRVVDLASGEVSRGGAADIARLAATSVPGELEWRARATAEAQSIWLDDVLPRPVGIPLLPLLAVLLLVEVGVRGCRALGDQLAWIAPENRRWRMPWDQRMPEPEGDPWARDFAMREE
jgi:hypothetical protein